MDSEVAVVFPPKKDVIENMLEASTEKKDAKIRRMMVMWNKSNAGDQLRLFFDAWKELVMRQKNVKSETDVAAARQVVEDLLKDKNEALVREMAELKFKNLEL